MNPIQSVLVVEDLPEVSAWLKSCAQTCLQALNVKQAYSIAEAKALLQQEKFDLALFDLGLPDGNGISLIPLFKQNNANKKCVITTIYDDAEHLFDALRAGADGYLLKDKGDAEFEAQLNGILDGRPPLSASIAQRLLQQFQAPVTDTKGMNALSNREKELLTLIARGLSVRDAAQKLLISYHTAASYLKDIYQKLQVHNRAEATLKAVEMGLVTR